MDTTQILLNIIITITTIFLVIIGIQLILLIRDLRKVLGNVNKITSSLEKLGLSARANMQEVIGFISSIKLILKLLKHTNKDKK